MDDTLIVFGEAVKALDNNGKVGGHLVLFGSAAATDASSFRDFFTKDCDFGLDVTSRSRILYQHGMDPQLGKKSLGVAELKIDDVGVWMEGQLDLRDKYVKRIWEMVKGGSLGFSSGTSPHLITREKQSNGSNKIVAWPLGLDASLTPNPAEPRTAAVALKSLLGEWTKGEHLGPHLEASATMAAIGRVHDNLAYAISDTLRDDKLDGPAKARKVKAAHDEARDTAVRLVAAMHPPKDSGGKKDLDLAEVQLRNLIGHLDTVLA